MAAKGKITSPQDSIQQASTALPSQHSKDRSSLDGFSYQSAQKRFNGTNSSEMGGGSFVDYQADHVERLQQDIELTTRKLELEQRRLSKLTEDLKDCEVEFATKRQRYKLLQTSQEDAHAKKAENVRVWKRRLELAMSKFNAEDENNNGLRRQIDGLRKERKLLDNVFRKMSLSIHNSRRAVRELNETINEDKEAHDADQQRVHALGKMLEKERKSFHKKTEGLKKDIQEENEKATEQELLSRVGGTQDTRRLYKAEPGDAQHGVDTTRKKAGVGPNRKAYMMADEEESFSEMAMHRRILKICFLNTIQRRHIKQHHKNIEVFQQAFATIRSSTGISDIEEIEKIFITLEQRNFSLLTYVNQLNRDIESIEIRTRELSNQLKNHKEEGEQTEQRKSSALSEINAQIAKTHSATAEKEQLMADLTAHLEECRPHIWNIVRFLKSEIPDLVSVGYEGDAPQMKVLPPDEHDSQMNHSLLYVEEALLLFRVALGADAQTLMAPAKASQGGLKKPSDLPSAHWAENDDDDDEDGLMETKPWSRSELRDKANQNIARRRRKPGQQGKLPHEERRTDFDESQQDTLRREASTSKEGTAPGPGESSPANFSKSPSMSGRAGLDKEASQEEAGGGRDEMWWRGQGREKKK